VTARGKERLQYNYECLSQWKNEASNHAICRCWKIHSGEQETLVACACLTPEHVADGLLRLPSLLQSPPPQGTHPPEITPLSLLALSARCYFFVQNSDLPSPTFDPPPRRPLLSLHPSQPAQDSNSARYVTTALTTVALSPRSTYNDTPTPLHKLRSSTWLRLAISDSIKVATVELSLAFSPSLPSGCQFAASLREVKDPNLFQENGRPLVFTQQTVWTASQYPSQICAILFRFPMGI
jgi:hypothetical protein